MSSNLPQSVNLDSAENVKIFFNAYGEKRQSFLTNEIDATVGFFTSRGFDRVSATAVGGLILESAKIEGVKVFELLDTLKGLTDVQLSAVVAEILNYNRPRTSTIGVKQEQISNPLITRNIRDFQFGEPIPQKVVDTYIDPGYVEPGYVR